MSTNTFFGIILFITLDAIGTSAVNLQKPEQIHIAFGDLPWESISVTWSTENSTSEAKVQYGEGELTKEAVGTSKRFVDGGPERRVQYVHRVLLKGLTPATKYVYRCGSGDQWSELFSFRTASESSEWSPTVAVYGDMGSTNPMVLPAVADEVNRDRFDAVIHVGDFAYNMNFEGGRVGDDFMRQIEQVAAKVPYMVCPGNHEEAYNFSHYRERFTMPGETESLFYSFNLGPAHFISINTEAYYFLNYGNGVLINQFNWLVNDLKEANEPENRKARPWIVVYGHKPMYCSNVWIDDCSLKTAKTRVGLQNDGWYQYGLEELFYKNGVDLALWGHEHSYERLWPVYDYRVKNGSYENPNTDPGAPVHITTGAAGSKYNITPFQRFRPQWSAVRSEKYSYTVLRVENKTHLHVQQIASEQSGQPEDDFWIIKYHHGPYPSDFTVF